MNENAMKEKTTSEKTEGGETGSTEKKNILKRAAALLSVKSLVTLTLTGVFAYLSVKGEIAQDFMTIYAVIIAFYFGTQAQKGEEGK